MGHLDEEQILQFTLGNLSGEREAQAQAHLVGCEECRRRQQNISSIVFAKTIAGPISGPPKGPDTRDDRPNPNEPSATITRGMSLGHYVLLERLGAGGMGEVFAAFDPRLDRRVALKLLRAGSLSAEEGKARLLREAQAMARLQHPNVIAVHDVGTFGDRVFIAMEFVEGETLGEWLRGDRTWQQIVDVFVHAGRGLAAAHAAGLVHRDFKPDNVLIGKDGRPRVVDFGLARQSTQTPAPTLPMAQPDAPLPDSSLAVPLTRDGAVMGTPGYMAPEQIGGLPTDARSDQFSFSVACYEALYGKRPYGGATLRAHASEIAQGRLLAPPSGTQVPDEVYEALARGLSSDPAKRWPDMKALLQALEPKQGISAKLVTLVASLAILAVAIGGFAVWQQRRLRVCGGTEVRLNGVWDGARKKEVREAFLATKATYADEVWRKVERTIDGWALDWVNTAREACEAAKVRRVDSEEAYELRQRCLDARLDYLRAQTNVWATADLDVLASASSSAASLEQPASCLNATVLGQPKRDDPKEAAAAEALRTAMRDADVLFGASKYAAGVERLGTAINPDAPEELKARARLQLEHLQQRAGQPEAARRSLLQATEGALRARDDATLTHCFARLAESENENDPKRADTWMGMARAAASTIPDDWEVLVDLALTDGTLAIYRRNHEGAQRSFEQALELQQKHLGPQHPEVAQTYNLLGVALTNQNKLEEAIAFYEKSLEMHLALEGPTHAQTAQAEHNLAATLRRKGRYDDALVHFQKALDARRELLGPENADTLKTMEGMARTLQHLDRREEALVLLKENLEVRERTSPKSKDVAAACELLAELYASGQDWPEAKSLAERELSIALETKGPDEPLTARAHLTLANALTGLGQWADAKKHLDEAMRIRRKAGDDSADVAIVLDALGDLALEQKKGAEAKLYFEKSLALRERLGGATNESIADEKQGIGRALLVLEQPKAAVVELEEVLKLLGDVDDRRRLARAKVDLSRALLLADPSSRERGLTLLSEGLAGLSARERERLAPLVERLGLPKDGGP